MWRTWRSGFESACVYSGAPRYGRNRVVEQLGIFERRLMSTSIHPFAGNGNCRSSRAKAAQHTESVMYRILRHLFPALIATLVTVGFASTQSAGVSISIALAPPPLPVYVLPSVPGPNYVWAPGYWAYGDDDYYWVPGTWVLAPRVGYLWTPGYWGWREGFYVWNAGYWGPHIGYYGGINYGHGYFGAGYEGGRWDHGNFFYNTAVTHVNTTVIHNTYVNTSP